MKKQPFSIHVETQKVKPRRRIAPASQVHRDKKGDYDRRKNKRVDEEQAGE